MRENPKPFEVYRHFKGNLYQILTLAEHSEDGRTMVVYQGLYGEYKVYVRSLDMFMSLTDTEKYPEVTQKYRFEKVEAGAAASSATQAADRTPAKPAAEVKPQEEVNASPTKQIYPQAQTQATATSTRDYDVARAQNTSAAAAETTPVTPTYDTHLNTDSTDRAARADYSADSGEETPDLDPAVLEFLDAETYQQKLNILASMKHRITDDMINTLAIASDLEVEPGPVEKRYDSLKNCLLMKDRFEKVRLF